MKQLSLALLILELMSRKGQTLRIPFADIAPFTDQQANDWVLEDQSTPYVDFVFGERPGKGILIDDFSSVEIAGKPLQSARAKFTSVGATDLC